MLKGLITALRTLTILPAPGKSAPDFSKALYSFVWVGLLLGAVLYGGIWLWEFTLGQEGLEVAAFLVLSATVFLTRGLHLDGLADSSDGFWGGHDRRRILEIMKDSQLGTFGVLSLVLILLGNWIFLVRLLETGRGLWLIAAFVISRVLMVDLAVRLPYARESGTASAFVKEATWRHWLANFLPAGLILFFLLEWPGVLVLCGGWVFSLLLGRFARKRIGGVTGDLLGACCVLAESAVLLIGSFV